MSRLESKVGDPVGHSREGQYSRAWKESHGGWVVGFAGLILVSGLVAMWFFPPERAEPIADVVAAPVTEDQIALPEDAVLIRVGTAQPSEEGPIRIAIYDSKESFGEVSQAVIKDALVPAEGYVVWEIGLSMLPAKFAIAAYHDIDDNGELNRALFNAPVEPYGFSNDARSALGPPTFEETLIDRPEEPKLIDVRVY